MCRNLAERCEAEKGHALRQSHEPCDVTQTLLRALKCLRLLNGAQIRKTNGHELSRGREHKSTITSECATRIIVGIGAQRVIGNGLKGATDSISKTLPDYKSLP